MATSPRPPPSSSCASSTSRRPRTSSGRSPARCTARTTGSPSWSTRTRRWPAPAPPPPWPSSTAPASAWATSATAAPTSSAAGEITRLTTDHTFVQTLIDEGRITEEESRVHPHRNLILRALDGIHEADPDLFLVDLEPGDRLLLCSDGACGVLDDARLADILSSGTPDYAAVELVRASLEAGSSDNVTCLVADVVDASAPAEDDDDAEPQLVGAAAELRRRSSRGAKGSLFRGHRSGDTGELDPVPAAPDDLPENVPYAIPSDPIDPEQARYAPRPPRRFAWLRRLLGLLVLVGLVWIAAAVAWSWSQQQYYVGEQDGTVVIFRGLDADLPGLSLSTPYETTDVSLDRLSDFDADNVREGIDTGSLDAAHRAVDNLAAKQTPDPSSAAVG